jgi:hypothetical protein
VLLLHCLRISADDLSSEVLPYVEIGKQPLEQMEQSWTGAKKCQAIVDEFLAFIRSILKSGRKGVCNFSHGP